MTLTNVQGAEIETPKALRKRSGEKCCAPQPTKESGERRKLPVIVSGIFWLSLTICTKSDGEKMVSEKLKPQYSFSKSLRSGQHRTPWKSSRTTFARFSFQFKHCAERCHIICRYVGVSILRILRRHVYARQVQGTRVRDQPDSRSAPTGNLCNHCRLDLEHPLGHDLHTTRWYVYRRLAECIMSNSVDTRQKPN